MPETRASIPGDQLFNYVLDRGGNRAPIVSLLGLVDARVHNAKYERRLIPRQNPATGRRPRLGIPDRSGVHWLQGERPGR